MLILVLSWAITEYHNAGGWPAHGFRQSSGIQLASARRIRLHVWPGGHDFGYWGDDLGFYAHALATCG
jgi:hypothetical protein